MGKNPRHAEGDYCSGESLLTGMRSICPFSSWFRSMKSRKFNDLIYVRGPFSPLGGAESGWVPALRKARLTEPKIHP